MKFTVSHIGQNYGPWSVEEILSRMAKMELLATDFIFDEASGDWIPLLEFAPVAKALQGVRPSAPPSQKAPVLSAVSSTAATLQNEQPHGEKAEWFVQRESHRFGPLTYWALIRALQEKTVFDYDLIWKEEMSTWTRLAEHPDFSAETIRSYVRKSANQNVFFARKHERATYMNEVIIHDNQSVYLGQTFQASEGGSGVIIENSLFLPGQKVLMHFSTHDNIPAFNAECEIVSKRYVKDVRSRRSPVPYGLKFVRIEDKARNLLREYFGNRKAA